MRKLAILIVVMLIAQIGFAQKGKVTGALSNVMSGTIDKALPLIKDAEQEETTKNLAKTHYVKGRVYQAINDDQTGLYKKLDDKPLFNAWDGYMKALELDKADPKGGKIRKQVLKQLSVKNPGDVSAPRESSIMRDGLINMGIEGFNSKNFSNAIFAFESILFIDALPEFNYFDTAIYYYAGIASLNLEQYDKSMGFFETSLKNNYEVAKCYKFKADIQKAKGDTLASVATIKEGLGKNPDDFGLLIELVNYYLVKAESQKAIEFLDLAITKDPKNPSLYFAKGVSYDLLKDAANAIIAYNKALEVNPTYFEAFFNLGAIYYNKGAAAINDAGLIPMGNTAAYDAKMEESKEFYRQAEPYFIKAHEVNPKDKDALTNLREIYMKLKMYDKAKEVKDKIDSL